MNSLLQAYDGPSVPSLFAHVLGEKFAKRAEDAPSVAYSLAGLLYLSGSGWLLLTVPNAFVRGVFAAMTEPGIELPTWEHGSRFNAHISVMSADEVKKIGADTISERGKMYNYSLGRLTTVVPPTPNVARVWMITVHSPDLQALRRSYGLSSLPHAGEHAFHITVAMRRRGVLGRNEARKESR